MFIVYGPQVTLVAAPTVEQQFSADGAAWDPAQTELRRCRDYFAGRDPEQNFSAAGLMDSVTLGRRAVDELAARTRTCSSIHLCQIYSDLP